MLSRGWLRRAVVGILLLRVLFALYFSQRGPHAKKATYLQKGISRTREV